MPPKLVDDDAMKLLIEKLKQLPQDKVGETVFAALLHA